MSSDSTTNPSNITETPIHPKESKSEAATAADAPATTVAPATAVADAPTTAAADAEYAPYPKLEPDDFAPVTDTRSSAPTHTAATTMPTDSNPYVSTGAVPPSSIKNNVEKVKDVLGKWGKKAAEASKKAEDLAGNMWQNLKTGPSLADAAVGRIARGTKVLAEGGYEKVFQNTFENAPDEKLQKYYGCYLSTSAGPVAGVIYLSTAKIAFCSDDPLSYKVPDSEEVSWSYYKVVIQLQQLKAVNVSASKINPAEKYIQIISVDNHEFWFMGFVAYDSAVKNLQGALTQSPHHL